MGLLGTRFSQTASECILALITCILFLFTSAQSQDGGRLDELERWLADFERIEISLLYFPGCTGPFTERVSIDLNRETLEFYDESPSGKTSSSTYNRAFSEGEIESMRLFVYEGMKKAVQEESIHERIRKAEKAGDDRALADIRRENPLPIGGYAMFLWVVRLERGESHFSMADEFSNSVSSDPFLEFRRWMQGLGEETESN